MTDKWSIMWVFAFIVLFSMKVGGVCSATLGGKFLVLELSWEAPTVAGRER